MENQQTNSSVELELNSQQIKNQQQQQQSNQVNNREQTFNSLPSPVASTILSTSSLPSQQQQQQQQQQQMQQQQQQHRRIFKIIVIGDSNVGKTCLTFRFCGGKFLQRSEATIGVDFREKTVIIDDEQIKLQIWDTAGQERFRKSMISHYYRNVHAVLFVYDVTNMSSFENLTYWIDEYNKHCGNQPGAALVPRILVGNKCDIGETKVTTNIAQTFADMYQMPLFETSAKDDSRQDHVEAIFMTLALKLKSSRPFYLPSQLHKARVQSVDHHNGSVSVNSSGTSNNNNDSSCFC